MKEKFNQAAVTKKAIVQYSVNELDKFVEALIVMVPPMGAGLYIAKSFMGYAMIRRQEELNAYIEFIRDHPNEFSKDVLESQEFQDGLVLSLESYLKLRTEGKRFVARQILLGFAVAKDKKGFPLERFDDTLVKISGSTIEFLAFYESIIVPLRRARIQAKADAINLSSSDKSREWWVTDFEKNEPVSTDIDHYLYNNYNPNSSIVKAANGGEELEGEVLSGVFEIEQTEREKVSDAIGELVQLGVMSVSSGPVTWGGGAASEVRFTKFGNQFVEYIKDSNFSLLLKR